MIKSFNFEKLISRLPDVLLLLATVALFVDTTFSGLLGIQPILSTSIRDSLIALAACSLAFAIYLRNDKIDRILDVSDKKFDIEETVSATAYIDLADKFKNAAHIEILSLTGSKIARLGEEGVMNELLSNLKNKDVSILLGDPFCESVNIRYSHDEPSSSETGIAGLKRRIVYLYNLRQRLPESEKANLHIRLFHNYPTLNILRIDSEVYFTPYGYKLRGSDCPKSRARPGGEYSEFLSKQFHNVFHDAIPIDDWMMENQGKLQ